MSIHIRYRRLPDREQRFTQQLVAREHGCAVTLLEQARIYAPIRIDGAAVLEPGAPIVWFTFAGRWHDVGRFHLRDGTFTGYYANVLTPVDISGSRWCTTDLCLDVWLGSAGAPRLLDEDEFEAACIAGWISEETATRADNEAGNLLAAARAGTWPPLVVREWTLERARAVVAARRSSPPSS